MEVKLLAITKSLDDSSPEELLEHAGRICYRSTGHGEPGRFLQNRIREGHLSLVEHASATFEISGISRACSHQIVRHRIASYSQESQRYVDMSEPEFVMPTSISQDLSAKIIWEMFMERAAMTYHQMLLCGIPKEDARFVLPNATATRLVMTMNFSSLRHFFKVRCDKAAQWEIRAVATEMLRLIYKEAPSVFQDLFDQFSQGEVNSE